MLSEAMIGKRSTLNAATGLRALALLLP